MQPLEDALAQLWARGFEADWLAVHQGASAKRIPLPTYPFERKRFWVEPPAEPDATIPAASFVTNPFALTPLSEMPLPQAPPTTSILSEANHMPVVPTSALSVADLLKTDLKALVTELSDLDLSQTPSSVSFMELGLDSLFLTQLTQSIRGKYNVKLTFRQIMGDYSTFDALADHIAAVAPKGKLPSAAPAAAPVSAPVSVSTAAPVAAMSMPTVLPAMTGGNADGYAALFAQQMAAMSMLMQQQLAILQGGGLAIAPPAAPLPVAAVTPSAPVAEAKPVPSVAAAAQEKELGTLMPLRPLDLRAGDTLTPKTAALCHFAD